MSRRRDGPRGRVGSGTGLARVLAVRAGAGSGTLALLGLLVWLGGCADPHWDAVRWPAQGDGIPAQPVSESLAIGVVLKAVAIEWEPEAVVVELEIVNTGAGELAVERGAIMLAWGELEYAVEPPERDAEPQPDVLELDAGEHGSLRLRYHLGRALTGPGARLIVRGVSRDELAIVELPQLELPAMPAR